MDEGDKQTPRNDKRLAQHLDELKRVEDIAKQSNNWDSVFHVYDTILATCEEILDESTYDIKVVRIVPFGEMIAQYLLLKPQHTDKALQRIIYLVWRYLHWEEQDARRFQVKKSWEDNQPRFIAASQYFTYYRGAVSALLNRNCEEVRKLEQNSTKKARVMTDLLKKYCAHYCQQGLFADAQSVITHLDERWVKRFPHDKTLATTLVSCKRELVIVRVKVARAAQNNIEKELQRQAQITKREEDAKILAEKMAERYRRFEDEHARFVESCHEFESRYLIFLRTLSETLSNRIKLLDKKLTQTENTSARTQAIKKTRLACIALQNKCDELRRKYVEISQCEYSVQTLEALIKNNQYLETLKDVLPHGELWENAKQWLADLANDRVREYREVSLISKSMQKMLNNAARSRGELLIVACRDALIEKIPVLICGDENTYRYTSQLLAWWCAELYKIYPSLKAIAEDKTHELYPLIGVLESCRIESGSMSAGRKLECALEQLIFFQNKPAEYITALCKKLQEKVTALSASSTLGRNLFLQKC